MHHPLEIPSPSLIESRLRQSRPATRLFASPADWQRLPGRIKSDPVLAEIYRAVRRRAEMCLQLPQLEHVIEGTKCLVSARLFEARVIDLTTVALVEQDPLYSARARDELLSVASLPDWGAHFLAVAEYALGVAIGLDWLYEWLTEADRDVLAKALLERAIIPSFGKGHFLHWLGGNNNLVQVNHAGLTAAALAVADREPALAARTIVRAVTEQAGPNALYAPDGVYPEGAMYWTYGTTFEVILITLLDQTFATDFGLSEYPGFLASADYLKQITTPGGQYFDHGDCWLIPPPQPVLHWFASKRNQPEIAAREWLRLQGKTPEPTGELSAVYERFDALALWWRQPSENPAARVFLPKRWHGRGRNPVAVFRSAWNDPRAIFVGIKGGSPSSSHAHMDAGSFVLEANGVRWAVDVGMQDYQAIHAAGLNLWDGSQTGDRWRVFRLGSEAHNILRFDQKPQRVEGAAKFVSFNPEELAPHAILDLASLYDLAHVRRGVSLLPDRRIVFRDEWTAGVNPTEVAWQWITHAEMTVKDTAILLEQAGETLTLRVVASDAVRVDVDDLSKPRHPFDEANPGLRRIRILTRTEAGQSGSLTVIAEPGSATWSDFPLKPLASWPQSSASNLISPIQ